MEIVKFEGHYAVIDFYSNVEFEGTELECEDYVSDNQDEYEHDFEYALEN